MRKWQQEGPGETSVEQLWGGDLPRRVAADATEVHLSGLLGGEQPRALGQQLQLVHHLRQPGQLGTDGVELGLQGEDPAHPLEVDPLVLGQVLDVPQPGDVAQRVATAPPPGPAGHHQAQPVVAAQGLRVHLGELGRHRDHEDRGVGVHPVGQVLGHRAPPRRWARGSSPPAFAW